jgi:hypothetical protein
MGEVVTGQARQLEVGNLVHVAAIFRAQRHIFGEVKINAASVYERGLGLIVAAAIANADEVIIQRVDSSPFLFMLSSIGPASPIFSATDFACVNSSR